MTSPLLRISLLNAHLVALVIFFILPNESTEIIISTQLGIIKGIRVQFARGSVFQFRNIPYAKPPLGNLRFRKPEPYGSWSSVLDGSHFGPSCMQPMYYSENLVLQNRFISEDCLSLNVYVPHNLPNKTASLERKSVMIWIYGGSYLIGQGELYDPSMLAATGDVIVVTLNYRLGLFGFLSTGDDSAPGNYGLWDQHLAITWVKNNIDAFGGNPNSITLFGQSAGGMSVSFQSFAIQNKGLFQRVIAQSGTSDSFYATISKQDAYYYAKYYAKELKCINSIDDNVNSSYIVSCMRQKSSVDLLDVQNFVMKLVLLPHEFGIRQGVVVDGEFVVNTPENILKNASLESHKLFISLDLITGNCNNEGSVILGSLQHRSFDESFNYTDGVPTYVLCDEIIPSMLQDFYPNSTFANLGSAAVCKTYSSSDVAEQGRLITEMYSDVYFFVPAIKTLNSHLINNIRTNTYQYLFNIPDIFDEGPRRPSWYQGSSHGAENIFLFGIQNDTRVYNMSLSNQYLALSDAMLYYWSNFAKTGDPNGPGLPVWPRYNAVNRPYINLNVTISSKTNMYRERMDFWTKTIPNIMGHKIITPGVIGK